MPIIVDDEGYQIIDGRNRYKAGREAGVPLIFTQKHFANDEERIAYVLDANLHRRHLNASQRAMVADKISTVRQGARTDLTQICGKSQPASAQQMNVSTRAVQQASVVNKQGTPDLIRTVESGKVPVSVAETVARMPEAQQARFVESVQTTDKPPHQIVAVDENIQDYILASCGRCRELLAQVSPLNLECEVLLPGGSARLRELLPQP